MLFGVVVSIPKMSAQSVLEKIGFILKMMCACWFFVSIVGEYKARYQRLFYIENMAVSHYICRFSDGKSSGTRELIYFNQIYCERTKIEVFYAEVHHKMVLGTFAFHHPSSRHKDQQDSRLCPMRPHQCQKLSNRMLAALK